MIAANTTLADRAVAFINGLTLSGDYRGKRFELRPWQEAIVRDFYTTDAIGQRQYRECGIWLPRKNAKTEIAAAICCFEFFCNPVEGEIYTAAGEREQAGIMFKKVAGMIRANESLSNKCKIVDSQKRIIHKTTGTLFWSLSSEAGTKHGFNPSLVIGDELHIWKTRDLWTALTTGSDTRASPMFMTITTAGLYDPTSLEFEMYEYACKVRDGIIDDPNYLPVIYAAARDADWLDEKVWHAANPALGDFRSLDAMRKMVAKAKAMPSFENEFRRLYLNQHTNARTRWINMDQWKSGIADDEPSGDCVGALDLSTKQDITALVLLFRNGKGVYAQPYFWIPEETAATHEHSDRVPYAAWIKSGHVRVTHGNRVHYERIADEIKQLGEKYRIREIAIDPWNAGGIEQQLQDRGFEVFEFTQNYRNLNEGCRELEAMLAAGDFTHPPNDCFDWMASNVETQETHGGHIRPVKASKTNRIDGMSALTMAIARLLVSEETESIYNQRGMIEL